MTQRPDTVRRRCLELRRLAGHRSPSGQNKAEAEAVVAELDQLVASEGSAGDRLWLRPCSW